LVDAEGFDVTGVREPHRHGDPVVADERGVVWIALPHDHYVSVPSPARASARFGACWFPR
jgi:hypothetical protein